MRKIVALSLLLAGTAAYALAIPIPSPEIDAGSAVNALVLISGAILVIRTGRKK